jgi:hypothetical protein
MKQRSADEAMADLEERVVDAGITFVADKQAAVAMQPGKVAPGDPAILPQPLPRLAGFARDDAAATEHRRGRPGWPRGWRSGGRASSQWSSMVPPLGLASVEQAASGAPRAATSWWCVPGLPQSVGCGPIWAPQPSSCEKHSPGMPWGTAMIPVNSGRADAARTVSGSPARPQLPGRHVPHRIRPRCTAESSGEIQSPAPQLFLVRYRLSRQACLVTVRAQRV